MSYTKLSNGFRQGSSFEDTHSEKTIPIAVVGMSLKFPGNATSAESFWSMIEEGRCASTDIPSDRLNGSSLYHPDPNRLVSVPLRGGHFLNEDISSFDAPFFSISAAEATAMDPQSRTLLETTYRALENAGIPMAKISNSNTSVYTGNLSNDFISSTSRDVEHGSRYSLVGLPSMLSGRLSWFFNLIGPCLTLDTACSSSLVALDLGCQSLYSGASDMSIVTGCSLLFSPDLFHLLSNMSMLSPDSKCYSFDHRANGYGRGEGIAALVLKRLPDAIRDGDTIRGVIRSIGVNQDGHTPSVTQPSKTSQALLIRETYSKAGISMGPTRYFEAHGTGTPVGDPIEASAIGAAFLNSRSREDPLYVGSVKSNVGHLEGASGLAGVIKAVLVLEQGIIPPSANFEKLNPRIDDIGLNIKIATVPTKWPTNGLRRVSVNSFGATGTNAHVVLDDAYHYLSRRALHGNHCTAVEPTLLGGDRSNGASHDTTAVSTLPPATNGHLASSDTRLDTPRLVFLSAWDKTTLQRMISLYHEWLKEATLNTKDMVLFLNCLVYTLALRRSMLPSRTFAIVDRVATLRDLESHFVAPIRPFAQPQVAFIFTGQGAQWVGMGRDLLKISVFRGSVTEANTYLKEIGSSWDVIDVLCKTEDNTSFNRPSFSQTLCTVIQIAIIELYRFVGLIPSAAVGHSSGEIAAAYCTGAISKKSALKLAYFRGVVSEDLAQRTLGGMMAVGTSAAAMQAILDELFSPCHTCPITVACINSPESVTVSGDTAQLDILRLYLSKHEVFHRRLHVDVAYHSPQMAEVAALYASQVDSLLPGKSSGKKSMIMISSVTADIVNHATLASVDYWVQNMLQPVRFSDALTRLCCSPAEFRRKRLDGSHRKHVAINVLLEIGPHAALKGPIQDTLKHHSTAKDIVYHSSMIRHALSCKAFMNALGHLHCYGFDLNLKHIIQLGSDSGLQQVLTTLPEYPFDHSRKYWPTGRLGREYRFRRAAKLDLLGKPAVDWNPLVAKWENVLKISELPWASEHKINGVIIYPAAGMLVMAIEAAKQLADRDRDIKGFKLSNSHFLSALVIPTDDEGIETQFYLHPRQDDSNRHSASWEYRLFSCQEGQWHENSHGNVQIEYSKSMSEVDGGKEDVQRLKDIQDSHVLTDKTSNWCRTTKEFYSSLEKSGYTFGPTLRAMKNINFCSNPMRQASADVECFTWEAVGNANHFQEHVIHPTTLDGILQTSLAAYSRAGEDVMTTGVPIEIESLWVSSSGLSYPDTRNVKARAALTGQTNMGFETSVTALDSAMGKLLVNSRGIKLRFVTQNTVQQPEYVPQACYTLDWKPDVDLNPGIISKSSSSTNAEKTSGISCLDMLIEYLTLAAFKNPELKILHFSKARDATERRLLQTFFQNDNSENSTLPHGDYLLADLSQVGMETLRSSFEACKRLRLAEWDLGADVDSEDNYDIVFASSNSQMISLIPQAYRMLKHGGKMILLESIDASVSVDNTQTDFPETRNRDLYHGQLRKTLNDTGFTDIELSPDEDQDESRLIISTKPPSLPPLNAGIHFILVTDPTSPYQQDISASLQKKLSISGNAISACAIEDLDTLESFCDIPQSAFIFLPELDAPILENISPKTYLSLQRILISAKGILWLSTHTNDTLHPSLALIDGLSRVLRSENPNAVIVTASLPALPIPDTASHILTLLSHINFASISTTQTYEPAYLYKNAQFHIQRLLPFPSLSRSISARSQPYESSLREFAAGPPLTMKVRTPGLLDSIHFISDPLSSVPLRTHEVEIKIAFTGLNFKDLLLALGRLDSTANGTECSGIISRVGSPSSRLKVGDRVCLLTGNAFGTFTRAHGESVAKVPDGVSLAHAAGVPTQITTAWYAIHVMARMQKGESILIHSGAGGTGQAAIQIAQRLGGEVFVTCGSEEKKRFLVEKCGVKEDHVFYSRDTSFAAGVRRVTDGRGVDVVLNSLAGESLLASWDLVALNGRFIELGKKDIDSNSQLPMRPFARGASFASLDSTAVSGAHREMVRDLMEGLLRELEEGTLRPVEPFRVLPISEVQSGMRSLQEGKMMGKIVFEVSDRGLVPTTIRAKPDTVLSGNKTYVIAGGTGGIGLAIAKWMVERGAKYLILVSRSGVRNQDAKETIDKLREAGTTVEAPKCDISNSAALSATLQQYAQVMPPIGGCIQAAMILQDSLFANMTYENWRKVTDPKTLGSWNLHSLLPTGMDFFILLSSIAGVLGSAGQANYAAGNTYMDALARYRVAEGEKAVSLDLGVMLEYGMLASNDVLRNRILSAGYLAGVTPLEFFALLDYYCNPDRPIESQSECQVAIGLASASKLRAKGFLESDSSMSLPFFRHIFDIGNNGGSQSSDVQQSNSSYLNDFVNAETVNAAAAIVSDSLIERLLASLPDMRDSLECAVDARNKSIHSYGVDSLQAIELRSWFAKEFAADIPVFEILGEGTVSSIGMSVASKSKLR